MSKKIFEIFGYPVRDSSADAKANRKKALCPFMNEMCDGGGNRYLSHIDLDKNAALKALYPGLDVLPAGVCSIQVIEGERPWIVCPRRLLALGRERAGVRVHQLESEKEVIRLLGYPKGTVLGVWPEVKIKFEEEVDGERFTFDYTFDYILVPLGPAPLRTVATLTHVELEALPRLLERAGYSLGRRAGERVVDMFPVGVPSIIEIMTSSTSGGDKTERTTIPMAFEDALLGREHEAPGINYRQVWARMVSQLIVKSEIGLAWGGKTIWVVQDALVDYIASSTALKIYSFESKKTSEVNMLSFSYGDDFKRTTGVIELDDARLYAGPMSASTGGKHVPSFQDMIRCGVFPPIERLRAALAKRGPLNRIEVA